jgi:Cu2+-exporting ATPase
MAQIPEHGPATESVCFHCGDIIPPGSNYFTEIAGEDRPMCCPGCQAVAAMIAQSGMARFYDQRTAFNERPAASATTQLERFAIYDDPALANQFSQLNDAGQRDARLLIGGVSCAACTWLIETTLKRLDGVDEASLNLSQGRLDVRFDDSKLPMSALFSAIAGLGYSVQPWQMNAHQEQAKDEYKRDLRRLAVAGIGMMQVGMFSIALHAGDIQGISPEYQRLMRLFSLLVTAFVVAYSARGFFESAWRHLRHGVLVMDLPVALAIGLAFSASALASIGNIGAVYFDSVVMFTFLLLLARFIEKRLRYRDALAWQDAEQTLPDAAQVWRSGRWSTVARREIQVDDRVLLRAGDTIPIDAQVLSGRSAVREENFSGEALPRPIEPGDLVFAGTINLEDVLEARATGSYADTRLAALQRSIDSARHDKPAVAQLADRIATVFIAVVLGISATTAAVWWYIDASQAFWIALSVLVISCPCALSLATPASLANAASLLRRYGVIVHGENSLEALAQLSHALFDKTGTLSTGNFSLDSIAILDSRVTEEEARGLAAALQRHSNHPLASAFRSCDAKPGIADVRYVIGAGLEGRFAGETLRLGSADFCRAIAPALGAAPETPLYWIALAAEDRPLAWIGLRDTLRPEAGEVLRVLRESGVVTELLTGDGSERAREVGEKLGFSRISIGLSPQDKLDRVASLQASGATVLMVGDGLNDAPVLKRADVSIAVAGATDLAKAQADFVVLDGSLEQVTLLQQVAIQTRRVILQNFAWALGYNALGIPLAALGLVPPWLAALGMSLSSLLVVGNSARLRRFTRPGTF